jgi:hypothetical protein
VHTPPDYSRFQESCQGSSEVVAEVAAKESSELLSEHGTVLTTINII